MKRNAALTMLTGSLLFVSCSSNAGRSEPANTTTQQSTSLPSAPSTNPTVTTHPSLVTSPPSSEVEKNESGPNGAPKSDPWVLPFGPQTKLASSLSDINAPFSLYGLTDSNPTTIATNGNSTGLVVALVYRGTVYGDFILQQQAQTDTNSYDGIADGSASSNGPTYTKVKTTNGTAIIEEGGRVLTLYLRINGVQLEAIGIDASLSKDGAIKLAATLASSQPLG